MKKYAVYIGKETRMRNGNIEENTHRVEFEGERLGKHTRYTGDNDTRGCTTTLYRTEDDRLIVYVEDWTKWQGETSTYTLHEVQEADLQLGGHFEDVGKASGYGRALTLDEALEVGGRYNVQL